jgi:hypothetical protein
MRWAAMVAKLCGFALILALFQTPLTTMAD